MPSDATPPLLGLPDVSLDERVVAFCNEKWGTNLKARGRKLLEESAELFVELKDDWKIKQYGRDKATEELGDMLVILTQIAALLQTTKEKALEIALDKIVKRDRVQRDSELLKKSQGMPTDGKWLTCLCMKGHQWTSEYVLLATSGTRIPTNYKCPTCCDEYIATKFGPFHTSSLACGTEFNVPARTPTIVATCIYKHGWTVHRVPKGESWEPSIPKCPQCQHIYLYTETSQEYLFNNPVVKEDTF